MKKYSQLVIVFSFFCSWALPTSSIAQMPETEVRKRLSEIYSGKQDQVRKEISSLEKEYPNDAGVAYLQAVLTIDGTQAVKKYQAIVDQYPVSTWADHALYKVYQYYYSVGLYKTAEQKMDQLRQKYPNSIYVAEAGMHPVTIRTEQKEVSTTPIVAQPKQKPVPVEEPQSAAPASGNFAAQAGVFSTQEKADGFAKDLTTLTGRKSTVTPRKNPEKTVYVVTFEDFPTEQDVRNFIGDLKSKFNVNAFLVKR